MDIINLFDIIPEDLLVRIINYYRYSEISYITNISTSFVRLCDKNLFINAIRNRIHEEFKISQSLLKQHDVTQLLRIGTVSNNLKIISAGDTYSLVLNGDGQVYGYGSNIHGQLGLGENRNIPILIPTLTNVNAISVGNYHSLTLNAYGQVYAFGLNYNGQLGLNDTNNRSIPTLISSLRNIIAVSTGNYRSLVLTRDGQVYAFGSNKYGQLGLNDTNNRSIPTLISSLRNIIDISTGDYYSLILNADGQDLELVIMDNWD